MIHESLTSLSASDVIAQAKAFFAERVPNTSAYPEEEGAGFLTLRGQGGEEIAMAVTAGPTGTKIRASTSFFDQAIDRFFSTLPATSEGVV